MKAALSSTASFNTIDAALTYYAVTRGLATEANPLMATLLDYHPIIFIVCKLTLVMLGLILLWRYREYKLARSAAYFILIVYGLITAWHIYNIGGIRYETL